MTSLLDVLVAFVGVMLILALAAQSLQELVKNAIGVKSRRIYAALRCLVLEAGKAAGLSSGDTQQLFTAIVDRLRDLGQGGVRKTAVRLAKLGANDIGGLIRAVDAKLLTGLAALPADQIKQRLEDIATKAIQWHPMAMDPVTDRYRTQMRIYALVSAALVVLLLNADAGYILRAARDDPAYRATVTATATTLASVQGRLEARRDSLGSVTQDSARARLQAAVNADRDSIVIGVRQATLVEQQGFALGSPGPRRWTSLQWWLGIIISTLLVSLGAPFWHDALETVFGLKERLRVPSNGAAPGGRP